MYIYVCVCMCARSRWCKAWNEDLVAWQIDWAFENKSGRMKEQTGKWWRVRNRSSPIWRARTHFGNCAQTESAHSICQTNWFLFRFRKSQNGGCGEIARHFDEIGDQPGKHYDHHGRPFGFCDQFVRCHRSKQWYSVGKICVRSLQPNDQGRYGITFTFTASSRRLTSFTFFFRLVPSICKSPPVSKNEASYSRTWPVFWKARSICSKASSVFTTPRW